MTTQKQKVARNKNWEILRLRGCSACISQIELPEALAKQLLTCIDAALEYKGAEKEEIHRKRILNRYENLDLE